MPLVLDSISLRFGEQLALERVSLTIEDGDCYGLIGHNGAGKTTLLRIALALTPDTGGGQVIVDGFDAAQYPREARARMGGLIEVPGFYPNLCGRANLVLLARLAGAGRADGPTCRQGKGGRMGARGTGAARAAPPKRAGARARAGTRTTAGARAGGTRAWRRAWRGPWRRSATRGTSWTTSPGTCARNANCRLDLA